MSNNQADDSDEWSLEAARERQRKSAKVRLQKDNKKTTSKSDDSFYIYLIIFWLVLILGSIAGLPFFPKW